MVLGKSFFKHRSAHEIGVKQQYPAVIDLATAIVGFADNLARRCSGQCTLCRVVAAHAVGRPCWEVVLHKDGIDPHLGEHVVYRTQLVKMDDTNHRMQHRCSEFLGKVIGVVDVNKFFHQCTKVVNFYLKTAIIKYNKGKIGRFSSNSDNT